MNASKKRFTLYELAIVIVVLAIIAAIVIPNVTGRTADAKVAALKQDLAHIEQAIMQQETEEPEAEILSKVSTDEISPRLKTSIAKNLKDDASEIYRVDLKKLKPYLFKTKYGNTDDDEDEYFFSKKTGLVYYEKGIDPSKGQRIHFLGDFPIAQKPEVDLPPNEKVAKIYATPAATYYLMENGDLYGEGYNFYGSLFSANNLMTEKNAQNGTLVYQKRKKIAERVKELNLSPLISMRNANRMTISTYITEDDVAHVYGYSTFYTKELVVGEISGVRHVRYTSVIYTDDTYGEIDSGVLIEDGKFEVTKIPNLRLKDIMGAVVGVQPNGEYYGVIEGINLNEEDKGKKVELVRMTSGYRPLFRIGERVYRPYNPPIKHYVNGELVVDSDVGSMPYEKNGYLHANYVNSYVTSSKKLYLEDEFIDDSVSNHYILNQENLMYQKGDQIIRFHPTKKTKVVELNDVKEFRCASSAIVFSQTFCIALTKEGQLYIGTNEDDASGVTAITKYGVPFRLGATGVSSFVMNETHEHGDVVFYEDKEGNTHLVRDNNGVVENRTVLKNSGAIAD